MTHATSAGQGRNGAAMIDLLIEDDAWTGALPSAEALAQACQDAACRLEPRLEGEIALLLTDDEAVQAMNLRFRDKDAPTNVLSFPADGPDGFLGDIALARETCAREAAEKRISLRDHAAHLIVHGMLHLIGYDHETDGEADAMERRETEILGQLGVADPYVDPGDGREAETRR